MQKALITILYIFILLLSIFLQVLVEKKTSWENISRIWYICWIYQELLWIMNESEHSRENTHSVWIFNSQNSVKDGSEYVK
jgi:hypothetical protein